MGNVIYYWKIVNYVNIEDWKILFSQIEDETVRLICKWIDNKDIPHGVT